MNMVGQSACGKHLWIERTRFEICSINFCGIALSVADRTPGSMKGDGHLLSLFFRGFSRRGSVENIIDDVWRTPFHFIVNMCEIRSYDAEAQQLNTTEKENEYNGSRKT